MSTKVLVVDDSALMRRLLTALFEEAGDFIIRTAKNGEEAVAENRDFMPDVVTLDINMPQMDGLTALSLIMVERPVPVVMFSSLTAEGALATFEALNLGAVDYVVKPGGTISLSISEVKEDLLAKVRTAARARLKPTGRPSPARATSMGLAARLRSERQATVSSKAAKPAFVRRSGAQQEGLVIIGVSTGGPSTLEEILPQLPADFPWPILVAQHMPPAFTKPFADRMNGLCALTVVEVSGLTPIEPGMVYIGKGGADLVVRARADKLVALIKPENTSYLWHPSVELLGRSVLEHCDCTHVCAVMLTGMGYDGADAFTEIKKQGGRTIAESEETAVVFGMPAELIERGGATLVLPAPKIATQLMGWTR